MSLKFAGSIKVRATFIEPVLGSASGDPDVHREYIASKGPNAATIEEEVAALGVDEVQDKTKTIFSKDTDGNPIIWDYHIKGFFKSAFLALIDFDESIVSEMSKAKTQKLLTRWKAKSSVDNLIYAYPRKIRLIMPTDAVLTNCERPLRAETMQGPRIALACSEQAVAGTYFDFEVKYATKALEKAIREALDYGEWTGMGQWRNSGKGRFAWQEIGTGDSVAPSPATVAV
jgi:hypothetical protein